MPAHRCVFRVYYEDTDAGGVMYHARYLAFAERARTEALRTLELRPAALAADDGLHFAVTRAVLEFRRPFRLDDEVTLDTEPVSVRAASLSLRQVLSGRSGVHAVVEIDLACVRAADGRPQRMPADWQQRLKRLRDEDAS